MGYHLESAKDIGNHDETGIKQRILKMMLDDPLREPHQISTVNNIYVCWCPSSYGTACILYISYEA